jgi:2-phosphosulfolactate phosphatase
MPEIDVCLSPTLLQHYDLRGKCCVVIDILRATSTIVAGLFAGVEAFYPVATLGACQEMAKEGYLTAAEREGVKAEGFDLGNSPLALLNGSYKGQKIAITTTNGTLALEASKQAKNILVAGFNNLASTVNYLAGTEDDVILVCSGWKGLPSAEDTLFAGAVAQALSEDHHFNSNSDSAHLAISYHKSAKGDYHSFLSNCSHVTRLAHLGIEKDINYCLNANQHSLVAILKDNHLVKYLG